MLLEANNTAYMRVLETFGGLVDSSRRVSEVLNMCGGGEFDGCEGRIRLFLDYTLECVSESVILQKTCLARAGGKLNKGKFLRCNHTH